MGVDITIAVESKKPYVYALAYPPSMEHGRIFYVGKGTRYRVNAHEREARSKKPHNPYKCNVIKQIWAAGEQVQKIILACFDTEQEAFFYEVALIFFLGELTNLANGGEGYSQPPGYQRKMPPRTEEHRRHMSEAQKGRSRPSGMQGKHHSPETKQKMSDAHKTYESTELPSIRVRKTRINREAEHIRRYRRAIRRHIKAGTATPQEQAAIEAYDRGEPWNLALPIEKQKRRVSEGGYPKLSLAAKKRVKMQSRGPGGTFGPALQRK